jgi:hypothetical protein
MTRLAGAFTVLPHLFIGRMTLQTPGYSYSAFFLVAVLFTHNFEFIYFFLSAVVR